ncbi:phytanoyl-CoA dioxygenase family protein [Paenibacillus frigoriresistens]|uniref:phytanoyl-CoA dioxygenase family protein n=1 Tax=Paenibacillus alginolyticus TaxID=59839 RepID=UPI0015674A51|nr:phytanoyl-CoA dioxygenase family protein [Paenibacillus frigoriresistens]NRF90381.1 phytanoyl-CoA dioxygenase family protein [Paenibacillus frigoriresistens]
MKLKLSAEELENQSFHSNNLRAAVNEIKANGYIVLEGLLSKELVDELRTSFKPIFDAYVDRIKVDTTPVNAETPRGINRFQMNLPFIKPFNDPQIIMNPFVMSIMDQLLGDDCTLLYFASDTPMPGSGYQGVHSDEIPLYPEMEIILPPAVMALNIPLVDITEENGATEIWPGGTHRIPESMNKPRLVQELSASMQPEKVLMNAGDVLVRDPRMWHRGTPNGSAEWRPLMALYYNRPWFNRDGVSPRIGIPHETYEGLPDRAKRLLRLADIGGSLINMS